VRIFFEGGEFAGAWLCEVRRCLTFWEEFRASGVIAGMPNVLGER
jgi:hypothetical protein